MEVATEEVPNISVAAASMLPRRRIFPASIGIAEPLVISLAAILGALLLFCIFIACAGASPAKSLELMYRGAFGTSFSWQNTLVRAAPLMLTGLCTALPLRLGMVIIGGEGALVVGGLTAAGVAHAFQNSSPWTVTLLMAFSGCAAGGAWVALAGLLRYFRGVNETISSLLLNYIAIAILNQAVEGWMHDPDSLNTPSTWSIGDNNMIGTMFGSNVHWGLGIGVIACILCWVLMNHTVLGFAARIVGGNLRAARVAGLNVGAITAIVCFMAGAAAGLAGMVEVAAVQERANANLTAPGYGYTGILIAFIARGNPLAVIPVAILIGGISASGGMLQRHQHLPDATVLVLEGMIFLVILGFETLYGRFKIFGHREAGRG